MTTTATAGSALRALADALDARDWDALAVVLAPAFRAHLAHTGETLGRDDYVALNRDYPGRWAFRAEEVVDAGRTAVLRARVTDADGVSPEEHRVAVFGEVGDGGLLLSTTEVWAEVVAPPSERRPAAAEQPPQHLLDHVELGAPDLPAATAFYGAAFGWRFNHHGEAYAGIRAADGHGEVGGLSAAGPAGPGGPLVLVRSDDLAASLAAVTAAGGQVVAGPYDYPGGRRFELRDPNGNVLGVYQPAG